MKKSIILLLFIFSFVFTSCKKDSPVTITGNQTSVIKTEDVVLYELFVRNFTAEGTFSAIIPRLQELKDLGVNTIWLMPIHPIGVVKRNGTYGSPYAVKDYYSVNASMGSNENFKELVNAIHAKGMQVIIDWVANHTAWDNVWVTTHKDWYTQDSQGNILPPIPEWQDVADLNYDNTEMRQEMIKAMSYWVKEFNIDGFRCDAAEMVPNDFWKEAITTLRKIKPMFMLAEGENKLLFSQGFDVCYSWTTYSNLKNIFNASTTTQFDYDVLSDLGSLPAGAFRMRYTTNHDETSWDKTPPEIFGGIAGAKAAAVISLAIKGIPLIYNGQEVGSTIHQNLFEKTNIDWGNTSGMRDFYSKLFTVYNSNSELRYGSFEIIDISRDIVGINRNYNNNNIVVIVNVRNSLVTATMPSEYLNKKYINLLTGETITSQSNISLNAYEYLILKNQ